MELKLYTNNREEQARQPVATLTLSNQQGEEDWIRPIKGANQETRWGLVSIETDEADLKDKIVAFLRRPLFVPTLIAPLDPLVQIRLVEPREAPFGSAAYWRPAIDWLAKQIGLLYDLEDYHQMLQEMERVDLSVFTQITSPYNALCKPLQAPFRTEPDISDTLVPPELAGELFPLDLYRKEETLSVQGVSYTGTRYRATISVLPSHPESGFPPLLLGEMSVLVLTKCTWHEVLLGREALEAAEQQGVSRELLQYLGSLSK